MTDSTPEITTGAGWAAGHIDAMGNRYGFRKVRRALDVTAFGVNAIVLPASYETPPHFHDVQEELYFVHRGEIEISFGDGAVQRLGEGGLARVDAATIRSIRNVGDADAVYLVTGGSDGYVGRDGRVPEDAAEPATA
jgi:uncharacterized cupin superfamily protein